jgi:hypothetical protein
VSRFAPDRSNADYSFNPLGFGRFLSLLLLGNIVENSEFPDTKLPNRFQVFERQLLVAANDLFAPARALRLVRWCDSCSSTASTIWLTSKARSFMPFMSSLAP